jgi:hypothetical protein
MPAGVTFLEEVRLSDLNEISGKARMTDNNVTLAAAPHGGPAQSATSGRTPEDDSTEGLISAALLTAAAFRLRDRESLDDALRLLVLAVERFDETEVGRAA